MLRVHASLPLQMALMAVKRHFLWAGGFSALLNLLYIAPTLYMLQVYDRVVPTRGELTLLFLTLVLVFALATLSLLDLLRSRLLIRASARLDRQLAGDVLDAMLEMSRSTRETMAKQVLREFDQLRQTLTGGAMLAVFDAPWTPVYILACLMIHPAIGLLALVGTGVVLVIARLNETAMREPLKRANEAANTSYVSQEQSTVRAEVIRALGMRRAMVRRHLHEREEMMVLQAEASFASGRYSTLSKFVRLLLQSLALGLGALLAIEGDISAGAIFASSFLLGRALSPIDQVVGNWRNVVQARAAFLALDDLLGSRPAQAAPTRLPAPAGRLDVEGLVVLTPARDAAVLANLSFKVRRGEVVAIIGPSGAGKSTLARAIAGGIAAERGAIRFDGADRRDWDQERLARHIGYLPQDPSLFAGSVRDNIARFSDPDGTDQEAVDRAVVEAAQACRAHDMILRLPHGYDTPLGWNGRGLSAGQSQRVALARAMFGGPSLVVLDEPNAHLDSEGESSLLATLQLLKARETTVLVIAHRFSIMPAIDKILVLEGGRAEMYGPRDEVLARLPGSRKAAPVAPLKASGQ